MIADRDNTRNVRPPMLAGRFYENEPRRLRELVRGYIHEAPRPEAPLDHILGLLAPHAGYPFSGPIAGAGYQALLGADYDHVLILAPSHYGDFIGAALPSHDAFASPLGELPIDRDAVETLRKARHWHIDDEPHAVEHAIEVQLPFLQVALDGEFSIVPVALGRLPSAGLAALLDPILELLESRRRAGRQWLVIASSDTYHGYDTLALQRNDDRLSEVIEAMDVEQVVAGSLDRKLMACGWLPLAVTMSLAQQAGIEHGRLLARGDSRRGGRGSGDYVVGYLAAAFAS